mmetsp:Transcript_19522/g.21559  ORF Transcript_19522/g.21559 Transcript_19522/m.21559 type:complete len:555 (+) Transcript_19522:659-2323(+)
MLMKKNWPPKRKPKNGKKRPLLQRHRKQRRRPVTITIAGRTRRKKKKTKQHPHIHTQTQMTDLLSKKNTKSECNIPTIGSDRSDGSFARLSQEFVFFVIGDRLFHNREFLTKNKTQKLAMDAFLKGCVQEGCVPCMFYYCHMQLALGRVHLALPWLLEGAIRGHLPCQHRLVNECYNEAAPEEVDVLSNFWAKILISHGSHYITEDMRNDARTKNGNHCFSCGKKEHGAADATRDKGEAVPLSKFTDPDSGADITVTPHRRNPEPKEEATSKKSRSKDEDGVLDISVIPHWRRKEVTPATVKKPTPTQKEKEDDTKGKFYEKEGVSIDCNPASRTTTTTQVVPVSGKQSKTTVNVCKVTGTPVINRGHEPTFTSPPKFLGPATTPHSRRAAAPAQEKLTEEEETRTGSCRSCLLPTTTTTTTSATTTSPTTSMMTTTTSTSDGSSASVTATPQLQHGDSRKICGSGNYSIPLVAKRVSSHTHSGVISHTNASLSMREQVTQLNDTHQSIPKLHARIAILCCDKNALLEGSTGSDSRYIQSSRYKTSSPHRYAYI